MKKLTLCFVCLLIGLSELALTQSEPVNTTKTSVVPNLVRFSGTATDISNKSGNATIGITFALYKDQQNGAPLWVETQNFSVDRNGHYSVSLGSTKTEGLHRSYSVRERPSGWVCRSKGKRSSRACCC